MAATVSTNVRQTMNNNQDPLPSQEQENKSLLDLVRKLLLAGVGAVVWAQESVTELVENRDANVSGFLEDVQAFVDKLVERGEIAEKDGRQLVNDLLDKRRSVREELMESARSRAKSAETTVSDQFDGLLSHLPTRQDIEKLTERLMNIGRKVDELTQQVGDSVEEVIVVASDKATEATEAVEAEAKKVVRKGRKKATEAAEAVAEAVETVQNGAQKAVRKGRKKATEVQEQIADLTAQVAEDAGKGAEDVTAHVAEVAESIEEALPA
jgi:polyhydroxyalkanoate synthesis regulator phasin